MWFADWNALSSLENPSWKYYSKLIFKLAISRPFNETIHLMSVTCFWHVKSGNLYILFINISSVKWIYRHESCCFIDITYHDPLMPHWSTELRFWPSDWTGNQSESRFLCTGNEKQKEKKKHLSYLLCGGNSYSCWLLSLHVFWLHGCCCYSSDCSYYSTFTLITQVIWGFGLSL